MRCFQEQDLEERFNVRGNLSGRKSRRPDFTWRTIRAPYHAEPESVRIEACVDALHKHLAHLRRIRRVETSAVKNEIIRTAGQRRFVYVRFLEPDADISKRRRFASPLRQRQRRDVRGHNVEALLRQPDRIGPRATAEIKYAAWLDGPVGNEILKVCIVPPRIPRKIPSFVADFPFLFACFHGHSIARSAISIQNCLLRNSTYGPRQAEACQSERPTPNIQHPTSNGENSRPRCACIPNSLRGSMLNVRCSMFDVHSQVSPLNSPSARRPR